MSSKGKKCKRETSLIRNTYQYIKKFVAARTISCGYLIMQELQETISCHRQPMGGFKWMADDVIIHGRVRVYQCV